MTAIVSIIVPVYNAERHLAACVQSLAGQTFGACEFIFVDDGSTDGSGRMLEQCRRRDSRIILIRQENRGVSMARNAGLAAASGAYIGFVDADDEIEPDMVETLYNAAQDGDCDAVICDIAGEQDGRVTVTAYPFPRNIVLSREAIVRELLPYLLQFDNMNAVANKLYRARTIREHPIAFPENVALGEDGIFNLLFMSHARRVKYIGYAGYRYREVAGSATRNIARKDYFARSLEVYAMALPAAAVPLVDAAQLRELKSLKLMRSVIAYIHLYLAPSREMKLAPRFRYVKKMIGNPHVRDSLSIYKDRMTAASGSYEKWLVRFIGARSTIGLYGITAYSRFRNRLHAGGNQ